MDRQTALVLTILFFILFVIMAYYGARITICSSLVFSLLVSLIILNIFYPPSQVTTEDADYTLVLYGTFEIISILFKC